MNYTPEQRAIRAFLSKPAPASWPCCCPGPQLIDGMSSKKTICQVKITSVDARPEAIKLIRKHLSLSLFDGKQAFDAALTGQPLCFGHEWDATWFIEELAKKAGGVTSMLTHQRYPACPCAMAWIVEIDEHFYKVTEHRSPDGITHTAKLLGPRGGPYATPD